MAESGNRERTRESTPRGWGWWEGNWWPARWCQMDHTPSRFNCASMVGNGNRERTRESTPGGWGVVGGKTTSPTSEVPREIRIPQPEVHRESSVHHIPCRSDSPTTVHSEYQSQPHQGCHQPGVDRIQAQRVVWPAVHQMQASPGEPGDGDQSSRAHGYQTRPRM